MATGINVSKANLYAVIQPEVGIDVSKAQLYAVVLSIATGIDVSKANLYAVVEEIPEITQRPFLIVVAG